MTDADRGADRALARLVPWLLLMYVLSYLDRANIGFAAGGLALVNSLGALSGFVSPSYRLWADNTFGAGAGLYELSLTAMLGSLLISALSLLLRAEH